MTTLDRYFELSDLAGHDEAAFQQLIDCFASQATIQTARGDVVQGQPAIAVFFREFFLRSRDLKHLWNTRQEEHRLIADWVVIGRRSDNALFSLAGEDVADLDATNRITRLTISFK